MLRKVGKTTILEQDPPNHTIDGGLCLHLPPPPLPQPQKMVSLLHSHASKGRTIRNVMGGGGGGEKAKKKIHARENAKKKNSCKEEGKEKKFMQKEDPIVIFI